MTQEIGRDFVSDLIHQLMLFSLQDMVDTVLEQVPLL